MASRDNSASLTQTVQRALLLLTCFSDTRRRLRGADLARELGLSQSTVSRLLTTMESLGFIERDPETGMFQLGWELVTLAGIVLNNSELRRQAEEELAGFTRRLGLSTHLAILRNDEIFYVATVNGPHVPGPYTLIGRRTPLHCTGLGKVLLAYLPPPQLDQILDRLTYRRYTPRTPGSAAELRPLLAQIRERGYAVEQEEIAFGRGCLAAPVRDASGAVIAALSVSGSVSALDLDHRETELARQVVEQADRISHRLGYITIPSEMPTALPPAPPEEPVQPRLPAS